MRKKDWSGQKYGRLTFVQPVGKGHQNSVVWLLMCECGNTVERLGKSVVAGQIKSCGCLQVENGEKRRKFDPIVSSARIVWRNGYQELPFETFYHLSQLPCHYCLQPPTRTYNVADQPSLPYVSDIQRESGTFTYNGLDRIDSSGGHTEDNVVPCCAKCNYAKNDMTLSDFLAHIERMYAGTRRLR